MYGTILILPMYVEPAGHTHRKKLQLVCVCVYGLNLRTFVQNTSS